MSLVPGARACVHSLHGRPELNGELVTLGLFDDAAGRWVCRTHDGGRVALRATNLQPIRADAGEGAPRPPMQMPGWARAVVALPWAQFAGGLCVTLLAGFLYRSSAAAGASKSRKAGGWSLGRASTGALGTGAGLAEVGSAIASFLPMAALVCVMAAVYAVFVDAGSGPQGTRLQQQLRSMLARAVGAASSLSEGLSALQLVLLAVGMMLSWALYTDQLRLDLDVSRLIFLPVIAYTLWRQRNNLHNMSPFQMLWILDMLMRLFRSNGPGHRRGFGGYGAGYGGGYGRRQMFF